MQPVVTMKPPAEARGFVYCPICTHTVEAAVVATRRGPKSKPGQTCPRCASRLDAAVVLRLQRAA